MPNLLIDFRQKNKLKNSKMEFRQTIGKIEIVEINNSRLHTSKIGTIMYQLRTGYDPRERRIVEVRVARNRCIWEVCYGTTTNI